jgi:hypothetical protein
MSSRSVVLLAALATIAASLVVIGKAPPLPPPGSSYPWTQPGCATVDAAFTQPPAWIPIVPSTIGVPPGSDYVWVQPGCAPVVGPYA